MDDEDYVRRAIELSDEASLNGNEPFGALLVLVNTV